MSKKMKNEEKWKGEKVERWNGGTVEW